LPCWPAPTAPKDAISPHLSPPGCQAAIGQYRDIYPELDRRAGAARLRVSRDFENSLRAGQQEEELAALCKALIAATGWAFEEFAGSSLRQIMLVHDVANPASCRVAQKAGYLFRELSPANPPHWLTDGHIHMRQGRLT
jgi:hypothetical protein